jgi:hypothetical protein
VVVDVLALIIGAALTIIGSALATADVTLLLAEGATVGESIINLSTTLPLVQFTSLLPPPAGPQINDPSMPEPVKCNFSAP